MKKITLLSIIMFLSCFIMTSQDRVSVEKSIFGVQTGTLGIWVYNESRLSNTIALRSEIGFDTGIRGGFYRKTIFVLAPEITAEPRFYYNLEKRSKNGRNISKNSSNFLALKLNYRPELFVISSVAGVSVLESFSIIPKWGIKRTVGKHFTYELGLGIGYIYYLNYINQGEVTADLHIRFGYTF
ncbi:MAG: hypothetical protein COS42_10730 [Flavobacteriales bacterium CG03_land_8_20_14_0_80_35_15]|nr:MAG: hypothetical protein COS42_10730 [Flavobacteriales bacterium CG03_land_8_20_14_0_80_35_15]